jgi:glutamate---cysteine ligase / carboxylate-amine ligase
VTPASGWRAVSSVPANRANSRIDFARSPRPTLGVEWEFALVDAHTRDLSNEATAVIAEIGENPRVHKELLRNTVEVVTGICRSAGEAMEDLRQTLGPARRVVRDRGMELFCAGAHPFAQWSSQKFTDAPRYAELIKRTQWWGRQMLIYGVHVHIGIEDRDKVLPISRAMLTYYGHLQALSASSPFWGGKDTGYASNRALMFQQLPTAGLPFQFEQWSQLEGYVADMMKTGVIDVFDEIRWDLRPSPKFGTLEVRICDGIPTLSELLSISALTHCLVEHFSSELDAGRELPSVPPWFAQENKWRSARYGMDAILILDKSADEELVTTDLARLLERLAPVAERLGCTSELAGVESIMTNGASYQRQRAAAERGGDLDSVAQLLVEEMRAGHPLLKVV